MTRIGEEKETITVEPIEDPVPRRVPTPEPRPVPVPSPKPEREPVPA